MFFCFIVKMCKIFEIKIWIIQQKYKMKFLIDEKSFKYFNCDFEKNYLCNLGIKNDYI